MSVTKYQLPFLMCAPSHQLHPADFSFFLNLLQTSPQQFVQIGGSEGTMGICWSNWCLATIKDAFNFILIPHICNNMQLFYTCSPIMKSQDKSLKKKHLRLKEVSQGIPLPGFPYFQRYAMFSLGPASRPGQARTFRHLWDTYHLQIPFAKL